MIRERHVNGLPGIPMLLILLIATGLSIWGIVDAARDGTAWLAVTYSLLTVVAVFLMAGLVVAGLGARRRARGRSRR